MSNIYKGHPGPSVVITEIEYDRSRGIKSTFTIKGAPNQLIGQFGPATAFAESLRYRNDASEPYAQLDYVFGGLTPGGPGADAGRSVDRWALNWREQSISIFNCIEANRMESIWSGAKAIVQQAVKQWRAQDEAAFSPAVLLAITNPTAFALANTMYNLIIQENDQVRVFQPIVSLSYDIPWNFGAGPAAVPARPVIYQTTGAFQSTWRVPGTILFQLPAGKWLEIPPSVQPIAEFRFEVFRAWEFAEDFSTFHYPQ
jgi:hypothetical protein